VQQTYNDLVDLASICLRHAQGATRAAVAEELKRLACEYQQRAAALQAAARDDLKSARGPRVGNIP
jgi:L-asparaginase II